MKNSSTLEQTQVIAESSIPTISATESSAATSSAAEPLNDSPLIFSRARVERLQAKKDKISSPQTRKPKIVEECSSQEASLSIRCECNHDAVEGGMVSVRVVAAGSRVLTSTDLMPCLRPVSAPELLRLSWHNRQ
jgi:hypothetical protein